MQDVSVMVATAPPKMSGTQSCDLDPVLELETEPLPLCTGSPGLRHMA